MAQSLSQVYIHIIFSTKNREKLINDEIAPRLFDYIGGICKGLDCAPIQVGGYEDHVHILCRLSKKNHPSKIIGRNKKAIIKMDKVHLSKIF